MNVCRTTSVARSERRFTTALLLLTPWHHRFVCWSRSCFKTLLKGVLVWMFSGHTIVDSSCIVVCWTDWMFCSDFLADSIFCRKCVDDSVITCICERYSIYSCPSFRADTPGRDFLSGLRRFRLTGVEMTWIHFRAVGIYPRSSKIRLNAVRLNEGQLYCESDSIHFSDCLVDSMFDQLFGWFNILGMIQYLATAYTMRLRRDY